MGPQSWRIYRIKWSRKDDGGQWERGSFPFLVEAADPEHAEAHALRVMRSVAFYRGEFRVDAVEVAR